MMFERFFCNFFFSFQNIVINYTSKFNLKRNSFPLLFFDSIE